MRTGAPTQRGTTLAELLIAVIFLAACTSAILGCIWNSQTRGGAASHRSGILAAIQAQIYIARATARSGSLTVGTTTSNVTIQGVGSVPVTTTISLWSGYTDLYLVTVSATWNEYPAGTTRADTITISTAVRAPDV